MVLGASDLTIRAATQSDVLRAQPCSQEDEGARWDTRSFLACGFVFGGDKIVSP